MHKKETGFGWKSSPLASCFCGLLASILVATTAVANQIRTNEAFVEEMLAEPEFDIQDIDAVFDYVFQQLPDAVTVYPTENYYYFKFMHGGTLYAGNFRLDVADRDLGIVHFGYFNEFNVFGKEVLADHRGFDATHGVTVSKIADLSYSVRRGDKTVIFNLNDLRGVKPPETLVRTSESYLGPVFDESGVRFFLLWNQERKMFLYVLDESHRAETHFLSAISDQIIIGVRTGFAYYKDRYLDRWILIGVLRHESIINSYYDGPFDQLPDNFVQGDELRSAFLQLSPEVEGKIDRFGNSHDLKGRMLADPYILYSEEEDLSRYDKCVADAADADDFYLCFAVGQSD
jgi:hypothetical protein